MSDAATVPPDADLTPFLRPTDAIDSDHPAIAAYAAEAAGDHEGPLARAVAIYYRVRDDLRYDPYAMDLTPEGTRASATLARGSGFCITKAVVYAACLRSQGIPSRLGFADVRNHLSTERLRREMQTDLFAYHGFTEVLLDGRWVKATPAFNLSLCEKFGVLPLEFDGCSDSIFHPFDAEGRRHMEYVRDRGSFADLPLDEIVACFREIYPGLVQCEGSETGADFAAEAEAERQA